jgi:uncharacterized protein (DUF1015 family)
MITITPVRRALVPIDSAAAARVSAPNYDEFQGDHEIWKLLQDHPMSVLRVTMAHCQEDSPEAIGPGDSPDALAKASAHMEELKASKLTEEVRDILWVYEIEDPNRPDVRQIGLGGMARTDEIRTEATPGGTIIRNEGVREPKARGRADLIQATHAIIGMVNNGVDDASGEFQRHLEAHADGTSPDFDVLDQHGNRHRVWIVSDEQAIQRLQALLAEEPHAYVADGNHRSAAAAMLGYEHFLSVFFPARAMGIRPYNRLVHISALPPDQLTAAIGEKFGLDTPAEADFYQPTETHDIGLYTPERGWLRLRPLPETFDPGDAAEAIDHGIVQKNLFAHVFGIADAGDDRLTFVGSNKDAAWLQGEVDEGRAAYAITLPAVTMHEFIDVCRQNRQMPPKSTWFEPKVRSGLVMALLDAED